MKNNGKLKDCPREGLGTEPNSMDQRSPSTIPGHFIQNSSVLSQSEEKIQDIPRKSLIFQVYQDVWEPCDLYTDIIYNNLL